MTEMFELWVQQLRAEHAQAVARGAKPHKSADSIDQYARCIDRVVLPKLREVTLRELRPQRVDRFLRRLTSNSRMAKTVLSQACDLAVRYEALDINPTLRAYVPPRAEVDRRTLTPETAIQFRQLVHVWIHGGARNGPSRGYDRLRIVDVLLGTGIRIGEVLALAWEDIHDLETDHATAYSAGTWTSPRSASRAASPAADRTRSACTRWRSRRSGSSARWTSRSISSSRRATAPPQGESNVRRDLREARGKEMDWVVPKTMRKTVATAVYEAAGLEAAQLQLGHATPETTRRHYVKPLNRAPDNRAALDEFSRPIHAHSPQKQEEAG